MTIVHEADMPEAGNARNDFTRLMDRIALAEQRGDTDKAISLSLTALGRAPEHINLRCHLGFLFAEEGRLSEAEQVLRDGLACQPESVSLCRNLSEVLGAQERFAEAIDLARDLIWPLRTDNAFRTAYASWLAQAADQGMDAEKLAALWAELNENEKAIAAEQKQQDPDAPPLPPDPAYVRSLFECYAEGFDEHLGVLDYRAPEILRKAIAAAMAGKGPLDIIDLGCGTGLMGEALRPLARELTGIDFAQRMITRSRRRNVYDRLIAEDMTEALRKMPQSADLIAAADVLVYLGDLKEIFVQAARVLRPGGCFAAAVEHEMDNNASYVLQKTRRYTHSESYIRRLAGAVLMDVVSVEPFVMRREGKQGAEALAFVLRKRP
ncbi:MAG: methyltransferase domain-containing protein [Bdellovibrionales bacterium]